MANLKFSLDVEPDNQVTQEKLKWAVARRETNGRTIPSTIEDELKFNPFMRVENEFFKKKYEESDPVKVMQKLRAIKDNWKPN